MLVTKNFCDLCKNEINYCNAANNNIIVYDFKYQVCKACADNVLKTIQELKRDVKTIHLEIDITRERQYK